MQVMLNEEEQKRQQELEEYKKQREEEIEVKEINAKAKRKKADKYFRFIVFGLIFLSLVAVTLQWLFGSSGLAY